jgi:thiamine biosynthesis protein ThiS
MRVSVNGKEATVEPGTSVAALIATYSLQPQQVAVEVNRELVPRRTFDATLLRDGDQIEIVTLVGGG